MSTPRDRFAVADEILARAFAEGRRSLLEPEVYEVLRSVGVDVPRFVLAPDPARIDANLLGGLAGGDVVVKVVSPDVAHKTDVGGVAFVRGGPGEVAAAARKVLEAVRTKVPAADLRGVMIVERLAIGTGFGREILASFRQDPSFGPVVSVGAGGILTEFFAGELKAGRGLAIRSTLGLSRDGIRAMLAQPSVGRPLSGKVRGAKAPLVAEEKVVALFEALRDLADRYAAHRPDSRFTIRDFELNPVAATADGRFVAVDGLANFDDVKQSPAARPVAKIRHLLTPRSALVAGASATAKNPGRIILENLVAGGGVPRERIYALHPEAKEIAGVRAVPRVEDLPEKVDLAVVSIPAAPALDLIEELVTRGAAESVILISGGFGEVSDGKEREARLRRLLAEGRASPSGGLVINGGNCLGIFSAPGRYNTIFLPTYKVGFAEARGGNAAIVSQSGAYLVAQASVFEGVLRPRYGISFGNQIDLAAADYLEFLADDPEVDVFGLYLEGFPAGGGRRFLEVAAEAVRRGRTVLVYKGGRTAEGLSAAASHTAAMAGDYAVMEQVLAAAGVVVCDTLDEFEDLLTAFAFLAEKPSAGNRVGIVSNAGFECTVSADRLGGLRLAKFSPATSARLADLLPKGIVDPHNPLDCTPTTPTDRFLGLVRAAAEDPGVDCVVASPLPLTPALDTLAAGPDHPEDITRATSAPNGLIRLARETAKPLVVCLHAGRKYDAMAAMLLAEGVPVFRRIDRALRALSAFVAVRRAPVSE